MGRSVAQIDSSFTPTQQNVHVRDEDKMRWGGGGESGLL